MTGNRLNGCVAIVTGGSTGIGYGCAQALGRAGVRVVITARTEADGRQAEADFIGLGLSVAYMPQDVASEADWERITSETIKHCVPLIAEAYGKRGFPGMAVNVSSVLSRIGQDGASAYCATKGGMAGLNQAYERMLAGRAHEVQVKSLLPGYTMTPQVDKAIGRDSPLVNQLAQTIALRRWAEPGEVGETLPLMLDPAIRLEDREVLADGGFLAS